jgi:hypothetical protein
MQRPRRSNYETMKQYRLTYPVNLKPSKGGFCTTSFEIAQQMDAARRDVRKSLRDFLQREGLEAEVKSIAGIPDGIGLMLICSDRVADRLKGESFVSAITPEAASHLPPKFGTGW